MAKPPFPWIGSKEKLAPYILPAFPPKLRQYVDPFGGSGAVLLLCPQIQTDWTSTTIWIRSWSICSPALRNALSEIFNYPRKFSNSGYI